MKMPSSGPAQPPPMQIRGRPVSGGCVQHLDTRDQDPSNGEEESLPTLPGDQVRFR